MNQQIPTFELLLFALSWLGLVYLINSLIARKWKKIEPATALLYFVSMATMGIVGEVAVNSIYNFLFNSPLWTYDIYAIHHNYTSQYAAILWGVYGFHLYLFHGTYKNWGKKSIHRLAVVFAFESILVELLVNTSFLIIFGHYLFYYWPDNMLHLSAIQALPFYWLCGYIVFTVFKNFEQNPKFFILLSAGVGWVVAFLTK